MLLMGLRIGVLRCIGMVFYSRIPVGWMVLLGISSEIELSVVRRNVAFHLEGISRMSLKLIRSGRIGIIRSMSLRDVVDSVCRHSIPMVCLGR